MNLNGTVGRREIVELTAWRFAAEHDAETFTRLFLARLDALGTPEFEAANDAYRVFMVRFEALADHLVE